MNHLVNVFMSKKSCCVLNLGSVTHQFTPCLPEYLILCMKYTYIQGKIHYLVLVYMIMRYFFLPRGFCIVIYICSVGDHFINYVFHCF